MDDDNGVGDAPRFVDGFLGFGVQGIERVEAPAQTIGDLGGLERIENLDGLPHAFAVGRTSAPARR